MNIGKLIRLNRIFAHPSGRLCSVAVDHFIAYGQALPAGLRHIQSTLAVIVAARLDAITMHKRIAVHAWQPYAGAVPLTIQSSTIRVDDTAFEQVATVEDEDAVRLGADAFAIAALVRGATEAAYLHKVTDAVREAVRYDMPVICHIYPHDFTNGPQNSYKAEDIASPREALQLASLQ